LQAKEKGGGIILAGNNYGQGSSREHAALAPMYLGVKLVLAKSFARIHKANLINFGILPCTIDDSTLFEKMDPGDIIEMKRVRQALEEGKTHLSALDKSKGIKIPIMCELTEREKNIVLAGGLLNYTREGGI